MKKHFFKALLLSIFAIALLSCGNKKDEPLPFLEPYIKVKLFATDKQGRDLFSSADYAFNYSHIQVRFCKDAKPYQNPNAEITLGYSLAKADKKKSFMLLSVSDIAHELEIKNDTAWSERFVYVDFANNPRKTIRLLFAFNMKQKDMFGATPECMKMWIDSDLVWTFDPDKPTDDAGDPYPYATLALNPPKK